MAKLISDLRAGWLFFATVALCQLLDWARCVVTQSYPPQSLDAGWPQQWVYWPVALGFACAMGAMAFLGSYIGYLAAGGHSQLERHVAIIGATTYAAFLTVVLSAAHHYQISNQQSLILIPAIGLVGPGAVSFYVKRANRRDTPNPQQ